MLENILNYVLAGTFLLFIFLLALSFADSLFFRRRINKWLESRMSRKKGSASSIAVLIMLGAILVVMLFGFGFIKFNFSG